MGLIVDWLKIGIGIVIAFVVIGLFVDNAATWGSAVGGFFTAIKVFLTSLISSSPVG